MISLSVFDGTTSVGSNEVEQILENYHGKARE